MTVWIEPASGNRVHTVASAAELLDSGLQAVLNVSNAIVQQILSLQQQGQTVSLDPNTLVVTSTAPPAPANANQTLANWLASWSGANPSATAPQLALALATWLPANEPSVPAV